LQATSLGRFEQPWKQQKAIHINGLNSKESEIFTKNTHPSKSGAKTQENKDLHGLNGFTRLTKLLMKLKAEAARNLLL